MRFATRLLAPLLALAAGCTPTYLLGVRPAAPGTLFASAGPPAEATADSVAVALRFAGYEPEWLVFEAEYHNDSRRVYTVDPADFAAVPARAEGVLPPGRRVRRGEVVPAAVAAATTHAPWPALPPRPLPALNPEPDIQNLQASANREAAKASRTDWLGIALFAVAIGTDIASSTRSRETCGQAQSRVALHNIAWTYNAISGGNRVRHAVTAEALARRAAQLRDYALRRTSLRPGQQVRGYVYLPRFDPADGLRVLAPLGTGQAAFDFVQTHQRR